MDILPSDDSAGSIDDGMARTAKPAAMGLSPTAQAVLARLKASSSDKVAFARVVAELEVANALPAGELIGVAERFALPGRRLTSRKAAIAAINKRFTELSRFAEKNRKAASTRPW